MKPLSYYTPNSKFPSKATDLVGLADDNVIYERITNNDAPSNSRKRIRRSRYDQEGRSFVCTCGKSYLSYAALYWHIKVKHNGVDPSNNQPLPNKKQNQYQNQRIMTNDRGEPTSMVVAGSNKIVNRKKASRIASNLMEQAYDMLPYDYDSDEKANRDLLQPLQAFGGPTKPTVGLDLKICIGLSETDDDHDLKRAVYYFLKEEGAYRGKVKGEVKKVSTLDKVMAQYLISMAQVTEEGFYKLLVMFVKIYHTCVSLFNEDCHKRVAMESVPEIGTTYMINKMKDMDTVFDVPLAIKLNSHFIGWLRRNRKSVGIDVIPAAKI